MYKDPNLTHAEAEAAYHMRQHKKTQSRANRQRNDEQVLEQSSTHGAAATAAVDN